MSRVPLLQGDADGFCGLYSVLNSVSYLFPHIITGDEQTKLMRALAKSVHPWPDIIWNGTESKDVWKMLQVAQRFLKKNHKQTIKISRPYARKSFETFDEFFVALHKAVTPDPAVAIIGLSHPWEHWSVAKTVKGRRIVLQDSCKVHYMDKSQSGLYHSGKRFEIDHRCTFLMERI